MVRIAAFPKCYLDALVVQRSMTVFDWIGIAAQLPHVEGTELYPPALESLQPAYLGRVRSALDDAGLEAPMMCASPDFTQADAAARSEQVATMRSVITAVAQLGGSTCRVLSGQRRPDVARADGIRWAVDAITSLLPHAESHGITLVIENHYKDGYWTHPEFAQDRGTFLEIVSAIDSPWFGVNYDPSNALVAGDDPLELLEDVIDRVVTMHASDRHFEGGTIEDLRRFDADPVAGYAPMLRHGVIGEGLIDYDGVFAILAKHSFDGWISIEDGDDPAAGPEHLRRSAEFLHARLVAHGLA